MRFCAAIQRDKAASAKTISLRLADDGDGDGDGELPPPQPTNNKHMNRMKLIFLNTVMNCYLLACKF